MAYSMRGGRLGESSLWRATNLPGGATGAELTIMGWLYVRSFLTNGVVFDVVNIGNPTLGERGVYITTGPKLATWNTVAQATGTTVLTAARWYHITMVNSIVGNYLKSFLNGVQETTQIASAVTTLDTFLVLNNRKSGGSWSDAQLGAIKAWHRALTASEIVAEMAQTVPVSRAGLATELWLPSPQDLLSAPALARQYRGGALNRWGDWQGTVGNDSWTQVGTLDTEPGPPIPFSLARTARIARYPALAAAGRGLFRPDAMVGLGVGGSFFSNPLG